MEQARKSMIFTVDTREPWPHPWTAFWPSEVQVERGTLETGDLALAALPDAAVIERKTVPDFLAVVGRERERFERELARSRYCGRFCIIVEGTLSQVLAEARMVHESAILGTVAAWSRRFCPVLFAGRPKTAADLAHRFLAGQVREVERAVKAISKAGKGTR